MSTMVVWVKGESSEAFTTAVQPAAMAEVMARVARMRAAFHLWDREGQLLEQSGGSGGGGGGRDMDGWMDRWMAYGGIMRTGPTASL